MAAAGGGGGAGSPGEGSRQASRQASPLGSPQLPPASPGKPGSPTSSDGCRCDATERRFLVKGSWMDGDKRIQLRLRICEPTGKPRSGAACLQACLQARAPSGPCSPAHLLSPHPHHLFLTICPLPPPPPPNSLQA